MLWCTWRAHRGVWTISAVLQRSVQLHQQQQGTLPSRFAFVAAGVRFARGFACPISYQGSFYIEAVVKPRHEWVFNVECAGKPCSEEVCF